MKFILSEEQLKLYKKFLLENKSDEASRTLPKKVASIIKQETDNVARFLYGDDYGKVNDRLSNKYGVEIKNDAEIASGIFSIGNAKLSDDTLIMNFSSALQCPSLKYCPITQKACYAVAGENRLPDLRRKDIKVHRLWARAMIKEKEGLENSVEKVFGIARRYVELLNAKKNDGTNVYKKPLRFIRFNEAGDFPCQVILEAAARFAAFAKEYGIMSMAYTANKNLNFKAIPSGLDKPIDFYIKINASRNDIELSDGTTKQKFFATPMDFKTALAENDKVEEISDSEANILKCRGTVKGENGINSIPRLTYGKWNGGEGWYYVCPCSFWKYNKDKAESRFYNNIGLTTLDVSVDENERKRLRKMLTAEQKNVLKSILNKVKSPCGVECAVCHDMEGGMTPEGERILNYSVLTATHGSTAGNFDPKYAEQKRNGNDVGQVWKGNESNPFGRETKYDNPKYDGAVTDNNDDEEL